MGELQHGVYDDECEGLTIDEINAFYDFDHNGDPVVIGEDPDQSDRSDNEEDADENEDSDEEHLDINNTALKEPGTEDTMQLDHDFDTEVCLSQNI
jgi:hypothetical protein